MNLSKFLLLCWFSSAIFDFISVVFMNHLEANGDKFFDMLSVAKWEIEHSNACAGITRNYPELVGTGSS